MSVESNFTRLSRTSLEKSGDSPYNIHGIALGEGDITKGQSGIKKKWCKTAIKPATDTLEGKPIVVDHKNDSRNVIGTVTKTDYKDGVGILYEGEIHDEELADKIENNLLEVSVRGHHEKVDEMEEHEDSGAKMPSTVAFENISVVPNGAAPSNTVDLGEHEELSVAELRSHFEELEEHSLSEGDKVSWADGEVYGIVRNVSEETVTVQVHTDDDNANEASGQEIEVENTDQLNAVDSFENAADPPTYKEGDMVRWIVDESLFGKVVHNDEEKDIVMVEVHKVEDGKPVSTGYTITAGYTDLRKMKSSDTEEMSKHSLEDFSKGDKVWYNSSGGRAYGIIRDMKESGEYSDKIDGDITVEAPALLIQDHLDSDSQDEATGKMVAHKPDALNMINSFPESRVEASQEELADYTIHTPSYDGTTESEWNKPDLEDFTDMSWSDMSEEEKQDISNHFIMSMSGFPAENFTDLKLPVVEPNGDLNLSALRTVKGGRGVQAVEDVTGDEVEEVMSMVNNLAKEEFDEDWSEEMSQHSVPDNHKFDSKEDAMEKANEMGLDGVHKMGDMWMPGEDHDEYMDVVEEMQEAPSEYEIHTPQYDGTTQGDWDSPMLHDFTDEAWGNLSEEEKRDISDHFMMTQGSFPPERFRWLKLAAVEPNGDLNLSALRALKGGHGIQAVDSLSDEDKLELMQTVDSLADEEFGKNWTTDETELRNDDASFEEDKDADVVEATEESVGISVFKNGINYRTMTDELDIDGMDNPVAVEEEELEELRSEKDELSEKVESYEQISESISELRERQEVLDDVEQGSLEELRETDNPIVMEESRFEELEEEVEQVKDTYATELAEEYDAFTKEELMRKYDIDELSEKVDGIEDTEETEESSTEDLESDPEPKSKDRVETETEELSGQEKEVQDELEKIGWSEYAD